MGFGHGKIILLGEHSVVHGYPAIAAAIDRGVRATARVADRDELVFDREANPVSPADDSQLGRALQALLAQYPSPRPNLIVEVTGDLPQGAGLGSSAALGVAITAALDEKLNVTRTPIERANVSLAWERVFHGNPSGVDSVISACGGVGFFRRGERFEPIVVRRPLPLVVGHSGEHGSTKATVAQVAHLHSQDPKRITGVFEAIEVLVKNGRLAIEAGDLRALGKLMDLNQALLTSLMVSTARLEELCATARASGAYGAKLTGGGGGGCMIALVEDEATGAEVVRGLEEIDAKAFYVEVRG